MQTAVFSQLAHSIVPHSTRPFWHDWQGCAERQGTKPSVRRRLFPEEPADEENKQFVQRLLAELAEQYKHKWDFDFDQERPLESGTFRYESVPAEQVPGFYRMRSLASPVAVGQSLGEPERDENQWSPVDSSAALAPSLGASKCGEEAEMAEEGTETKKSPSRALRKPRPTANRTPSRRRTTEGEGGGGVQTRLTEFMQARKGLARSAAKLQAVKEGGLGQDSPSKRRRHSQLEPSASIPLISPSPIKKTAEGRRSSQRLGQAVRMALFK